MTTRHPDGKNAPTAHRARQLVACMGFETSTDFARFLKIEPDRWRNFERGYPFSREVANRLVAAFPGITRDWLHEGNANGLSVEMARMLGEIPEGPPHLRGQPARRRA